MVWWLMVWNSDFIDIFSSTSCCNWIFLFWSPIFMPKAILKSLYKSKCINKVYWRSRNHSLSIMPTESLWEGAKLHSLNFLLLIASVIWEELLVERCKWLKCIFWKYMVGKSEWLKHKKLAKIEITRKRTNKR